MPNFRCCPSHSHPKPQPPARRGHREPARAIRVRHPSQEQPPIKITGSSLNDACQLPVQFRDDGGGGEREQLARSREHDVMGLGTGRWSRAMPPRFVFKFFPGRPRSWRRGLRLCRLLLSQISYLGCDRRAVGSGRHRHLGRSAGSCRLPPRRRRRRRRWRHCQFISGLT